VRGAVVWLTGLPASGTSTLARSLVRTLKSRRTPCALLDGDEIRQLLVPAPGYGSRARSAFYRTLAGLAALLARQGLIAVVAATAHKRNYRSYARRLAPRFVEVYLEVSAEVCARRDPKGLYARARGGRALRLPGATLRYEPPESPEVVAGGGRDRAALGLVLRILHRKNGLESTPRAEQGIAAAEFARRRPDR
jgi:adenylylsulfate kinase